MSRESMKLALHTLEGWANYGKWVWPESALEQAKRNTTESIAALRQALETKREWVGLTLNEAEDFYDKYTDRAELINAIDKFLEEKNT